MTIWLLVISFLSCAIVSVSSLSLSSNNNDNDVRRGKRRIAVIGGGPSGVFAAISAAQTLQDEIYGRNENESASPTACSVTIYESSDQLLRSLIATKSMKRFAHGDREVIEILPDISKPLREVLLEGYPRGRKEITSIMTKSFPPTQQQKWFEEHGVELIESNCSDEGGRLVGASTTAHLRQVLNVLENHAHIQKGIVCIKTNSRVTDIDCIRSNAADSDETTSENSVDISSARKEFRLTIQDNNRRLLHQNNYDCIILATGCSFQGYRLAKSLGHTIIRPTRSMFGFQYHLPTAKPSSQVQDSSSTNHHFMAKFSSTATSTKKKDRRKHGKTGNDENNTISDATSLVVTAPFARLSYNVKVPQQKRPRVFKAEGPVQFGVDVVDDNIRCYHITGKAPLQLSSLAAKELKEVSNYRGTLHIHFGIKVGNGQIEEIYDVLWDYRQKHSGEVVLSKTQPCPLVYAEVDYDDYDFETDSFAVHKRECIPIEIWHNLCQQACYTGNDDGGGITETTKWGNLSPKKVRKIADYVVSCPFDFNGRYATTTASSSTNSLSSIGFVNSGGIDLKQLDMRTLSSKVCQQPDGGLYCCGQMLNVDGISNGYTRMLDWVTGYVAGTSAAKYVVTQST